MFSFDMTLNKLFFEKAVQVTLPGGKRRVKKGNMFDVRNYREPLTEGEAWAQGQPYVTRH